MKSENVRAVAWIVGLGAVGAVMATEPGLGLVLLVVLFVLMLKD